MVDGPVLKVPERFSADDPTSHVRAWKWIIRHLREFAEECLDIRDEMGNTVPLILNNIQRKALAQFVWEFYICKEPVRWIVLKSRRMGWSTFVAFIYFVLTKYQPRHRALIMAHDSDATRTLYEMHQVFEQGIDARYGQSDYETNAIVIPRSSSTGYEMRWYDYDEERHQFLRRGGSRISIKTAGTSTKGGKASDALNFLHCSEIGYSDPPPWEQVTTFTFQTVPHAPFTSIIQEGTANGVGNYLHKNWLAAINADSMYAGYRWRPIFDPWWAFEKYRLYDNDEPIEPFGFTGEERDTDALELIKLRDMMKQNGMEKRDIEAALRWRQQVGIPAPEKGGGDIARFHQQYPATWQEAFVTTGDHYFDNAFLVDKIAECSEFVKKQREALVIESGGKGMPAIHTKRYPIDERTKNGPYLRIWFPPTPSDRYCLTADPGYGTGGDPAGAIVWNWEKRRVEAVWMASLANVAQQVEDWVDIGTRYATGGVPSEIIYEQNGPGQSVASILIDAYKYPNVYCSPKHWRHTRATEYGFVEGANIRKELLTHLKNQYRTYTCYDKRVWEQFTTMEHGHRKIEARSGAHDEFVICAGMFAYVGNERGETFQPTWKAPTLPDAPDDTDGGKYIVIRERNPDDPTKEIVVRAIVESGRAFPDMYYGRNHVTEPQRNKDRRTAWMRPRWPTKTMTS